MATSASNKSRAERLERGVAMLTYALERYLESPHHCHGHECNADEVARAALAGEEMPGFISRTP